MPLSTKPETSSKPVSEEVKDILKQPLVGALQQTPEDASVEHGDNIFHRRHELVTWTANLTSVRRLANASNRQWPKKNAG